VESKTQIIRNHYKRLLTKVALVLPSIILALYIITPAVKTTAGIISFELGGRSSIVDEDSQRKTGRNLQKFFRKYDTVIDLDDIINGDSLRRSGNLSFELSGCLESPYTLFVPIKFRLPYYGIKVFEWCLKLKK
jgi:hypothetical protein